MLPLRHPATACDTKSYVLYLLRGTYPTALWESGLATCSRLRDQAPGGHRYLSRPRFANSECDDGHMASMTFDIPSSQSWKAGREGKGGIIRLTSVTYTTQCTHPSFQHYDAVAKPLSNCHFLPFRWSQCPSANQHSISTPSVLKPSSTNTNTRTGSMKNKHTITLKNVGPQLRILR